MAPPRFGMAEPYLTGTNTASLLVATLPVRPDQRRLRRLGCRPWGRGSAAFRERGRELQPLRGLGAQARPRDRAGAVTSGLDRAHELRSAPPAPGPGPARHLLRGSVARGHGRRAALSLWRALRRRAVRRGGRRTSGSARRPRHESLPGARRARRAGRARPRLRGDRQPLEGRLRPGDPEPEPDARAGRDGGAFMNERALRATGDAAAGGVAAEEVAGDSFFRSRWVTPPDGVEEVNPAQLAPGFRAAAVACGLKGGGETDVGLPVCDSGGVSSAMLLTRNAAAAAPVRVCRQECERDALRGAVVNSGNANAATGEQGYCDALAMRDAGAEMLELPPASVAVAATG